MPLVLLPVGLLVREGSINRDFYSDDFLMIAITAVYSLVSIVYFVLLKLRPEHVPRLLFQILFHILTMLFVLFVAGFLSAFLAVWILLMISADLHFGRRGFWMSLGLLTVTGALTLIVRPETPFNERVEILQAIVVIGLIGYVIARFRGITDREREALASSKDQESFERERLLALINSMGDAVMTTDTAGKIKIYNAAFLNLLDTNKSLLDKDVDDVLHLKDRSGRAVRLMDEIKNVRQVFSRSDLAYTFNDNETIRLYVSVAPIRPGYQGHIERGFIFIVRDITKEKTLEEERDEFISVVSHELRTPVTIAEGSLSNLLFMQSRGAEPEVLTKAAKTAHDQILYLAKMVNDLSTLSRAERGVGDTVEDIDLNELFLTLFKKYEPEAKAKNLHIDLDIPTRLPHVETSRLYLEEILQNFLTNAIKYTQEGSVTLHGHKSDKGVKLAVSDTGIGISKTDQTKIFQKFYRAEDYRIRETSGTGLGLYVVKKLAAKLGIAIEFKSRLNHGSQFGFELPIKYVKKKDLN